MFKAPAATLPASLEDVGDSLAAVFVPVLQFGNDIALKGTLRIDFTNGALELGP